jgi:formate dehydrogenase
MAKVLCVLYDDPVDGYPTSYARDAIPAIERYPGGQTAPTPEGIDFVPGELLGSVSGDAHDRVVVFEFHVEMVAP